MIIQVHTEDERGYINNFEDFTYRPDTEEWINSEGREIGYYINYLVNNSFNRKIVIKKYER